DDERTLVIETRRFFESSLLVMWLEYDEEQQHLEEQWRQSQHPQGGQLQQPPSMRDSLSALPPFHPFSTLPPFPHPSPPFHPSPPPSSPPLSPPGLPPVPLPSPPPLPPPSPIPAPSTTSQQNPALSATAMRQLFLCPCELGQQPSLACSLRTCLHCKSRRLQLQPDADGSVMLTVRQYGKPSSAVGSRPVELLCMRVSLSKAVGMLNKQMPEYIKHHRLAHHQLQVFREHRKAVKAGQDGKVVISCDWSKKLTVERSVEIMSEHWHAAQIGIPGSMSMHSCWSPPAIGCTPDNYPTDL
ncbi:hypothetical protein QJQ45_024618, partial [Haematococcus lacustris]